MIILVTILILLNKQEKITDDKTVLAEQSDYVWDPEWSHESFIKIPTDISSQAISTISIEKDYVRVYPLTVEILYQETMIV